LGGDSLIFRPTSKAIVAASFIFCDSVASKGFFTILLIFCSLKIKMANSFLALNRDKSVNNFKSLILLAWAIGILASFTACQQEAQPPAPPPPAVNVVTIRPQTIPAVFEYVGVAQSSHLVEIRARVEGYLEKIAYREGDLVHANDLLFELDSKPFLAALAQAKAVEEQQEALLWDAQRAVERFKPLYEQKAASKRDLDNALAQEQGAKAAVNAAKAQVTQAELNLGYTKIHSPITGLSGQSKFREGALVSPGAASLMTTISALDPIWVNFNVSEGDMLKYREEVVKGHLKLPKDLNFEIEVILANGSALPSKGKVDFADPNLQAATGSMNVRAVIPNPEEILKPGQFVRTRLIGATRPDAIVVPQRAVMQGSKGLFVYLVNNENVVEIAPVEAGAWYKEDWIIKSGLRKDDKVIVDGTNKVMPGMTVKAEELSEPKP
jgi:membrane fusion protein, multidrug efflux system